MTNKIRTLLLGALLVVGMAFTQALNAANIKEEVYINGKGWALVKVGSWPQYGGSVQWDGSRWVTDCVARGELMRITVTASAGEYAVSMGGFDYGIWCDSKTRYLLTRLVSLPYVDSSYIVPTDTSLDNLYVDMYTNFGRSSKRIPIGPRR